MLKKILNKAIVGAGISGIITSIVQWYFIGGISEISGSIVLRSYIIWLIAGAFYGISTIVIYDGTRCSLLLKTFLHITMCMAITFISISSMQLYAYTEMNVSINYWFSMGLFLVIYFVIWCGFYLYEVVQMKKINGKLQSLNQK